MRNAIPAVGPRATPGPGHPEKAPGSRAAGTASWGAKDSTELAAKVQPRSALGAGEYQLPAQVKPRLLLVQTQYRLFISSSSADQSMEMSSKTGSRCLPAL